MRYILYILYMSILHKIDLIYIYIYIFIKYILYILSVYTLYTVNTIHTYILCTLYTRYYNKLYIYYTTTSPPHHIQKTGVSLTVVWLEPLKVSIPSMNSAKVRGSPSSKSRMPQSCQRQYMGYIYDIYDVYMGYIVLYMVIHYMIYIYIHDVLCSIPKKMRMLLFSPEISEWCL